MIILLTVYTIYESDRINMMVHNGEIWDIEYLTFETAVPVMSRRPWCREWSLKLWSTLFEIDNLEYAIPFFFIELKTDRELHTQSSLFY